LGHSYKCKCLSLGLEKEEEVPLADFLYIVGIYGISGATCSLLFAFYSKMCDSLLSNNVNVREESITRHFNRTIKDSSSLSFIIDNGSESHSYTILSSWCSAFFSNNEMNIIWILRMLNY